MPRRRAEPTTQLNVRLPDDLIEAVKTKLNDPVRNKTKYGSVSDLISALLYRWAMGKDPQADDLTTL